MDRTRHYAYNDIDIDEKYRILALKKSICIMFITLTKSKAS